MAPGLELRDDAMPLAREAREPIFARNAMGEVNSFFTLVAMRYGYALAFLFAMPLAAQPFPGNCTLGTAQAILEVNNASACFRTTGELLSCGLSTEFEVDGVGAVFASGLWLGGMVNGELRFAGSTYGPYDFYPGPIGDDGRPVDINDCSDHDRVYTVSRADIAAYENGAMPTSDLADWPAAIGAPVIDGDGDPTNYDLASGDRPDLRGGDETAWWVLNDTGNFRRWATNSPVMGVEIQMQAWAYSDPSRSFLDNTIFYHATLRYQGQGTLEDAILGLWFDADLGDAADDFLGSDPDRDLVYIYNGDNNDEGGYGDRPAALGVTFLDGFSDASGDTGAYSAIYYDGFSSGEQGAPVSGRRGADAYAYMQGFWRDGTPFTVGGDGYNDGTTETRFVFTGTPPSTGWTEPAAGTTPGDRLFLLSTGPATMAPGDVQEASFAVAWARAAAPGAAAHFDAVAALITEVDAVRSFIATDGEPGASPKTALALSAASPNPASGVAQVRVSLAAPEDVAVEVVDALGRRLAILHDGPLAPGTHALTFEASRLPAGVYVVRASSASGMASQRVTVVR